MNSGSKANPIIVASGVAVGCMIFDHLPEPAYNTFHDPGASVMLSIILADAFTLAMMRSRFAWLLLVPGIILKMCIQPLFWIENALFLDIGTLLLCHGLIGWLAFHKLFIGQRVVFVFISLSSIVLAMVLLRSITKIDTSWIAMYWQLGLSRILIPTFFWGTVQALEINCTQNIEI